MVSFISRVFKGMIIALGFILPGVSGGVLAAILGIYERMISFLAHMRDNFIENVLFFLTSRNWWYFRYCSLFFPR